MIPGEPLHIVDRGVNRGACFVDDSDRAFYLDLLEEQLPKWQCELHAFVLMSNHVHLLLTPWSETAAAALMRRVAQRHTQRFNKRWQRTGPMWEGRFQVISDRVASGNPDLPAIYRGEPAKGRNGKAPGGVSMVELPGKRPGCALQLPD